MFEVSGRCGEAPSFALNAIFKSVSFSDNKFEWPLRMVARSLFTLLNKYLLLESNIPGRCK